MNCPASHPGPSRDPASNYAENVYYAVSKAIVVGCPVEDIDRAIADARRDNTPEALRRRVQAAQDRQDRAL